jgi:hypothetical protein
MEGVWLTYKDFNDEKDRSIFVKLTPDLRIEDVGDLCAEVDQVLSEQYGYAMHVSIAKNNVVLVDRMPIQAYISLSPFYPCCHLLLARHLIPPTSAKWCTLQCTHKHGKTYTHVYRQQSEARQKACPSRP